MPRIRAATIGEHKSLVRAGLLDAARRLIEEEESADISLAEVALAAGVGRTTFYEYFTDRDDVIASLAEAELPVILSELIASVDTNLPIRDRLAILVTKTIEFVATDRVFGVILHREVGRLGIEAQARIRDTHAMLASEMTTIYVRGVEEGEFRAMPPRVAGRLIQDTIMSGARLLIVDPEDMVVVVGHVRDFLLGGLGHGTVNPPVTTTR
jgi:AcrR family transcriptional regulator